MSLSPLDSCREAFSSLNILTFINVYIYEIVCFFYKNKNKFLTDRANYQYETRHKSSLLTPKHNTALFEKGSLYNGFKLFNAIPDNTKQIPTIEKFKIN